MSFFSAIGRGHGARQIVNYLTRQYPQLAPVIEKLSIAGYASEQILKHLDKGNKGSSNDPDDYLTEHEKVQKSRSSSKKKQLMGVAGTLAAAGILGAGAYGMAARGAAIYPDEILPALAGGLKPLGGPGTPPLIPPTVGGGPGGVPQQPTPGAPPQAPPSASSAPLNPVVQALTKPSQDSMKSVQLVKNLREEARIANSLKGHDAVTASLILRQILPKEKMQILEQAEGGLEQVLTDYKTFLESQGSSLGNQPPEDLKRDALERLRKNYEREAKPYPEKKGLAENELERFEQNYGQQGEVTEIPGMKSGEQMLEEIPGKNLDPMMQEQPVAPEMLPQVQEEAPPPEMIEQSPEIEEPEVIEELKDIVITPVGAGELKHKGKSGVIAEVDGKQQSFNPDELTVPSDEATEFVKDLLKIPEEDRSSNVSLFTYDPDESKMYIQFHDGTSYKYMGMDPEIVRKIAEKEAVPITSGKNVFGEWSPDDKQSLGAALWAYVLKDPKYAKPKKGEPPNPNYVKLETLYDYWKSLRKQPKRKKK